MDYVTQFVEFSHKVKQRDLNGYEPDRENPFLGIMAEVARIYQDDPTQAEVILADRIAGNNELASNEELAQLASAAPQEKRPKSTPYAAEGYLGRNNVSTAMYREEAGCAELMAELFAGKITYNYTDEMWYVWNSDTRRWVVDTKESVRGLVSTDLSMQFEHFKNDVYQDNNLDAKQKSALASDAARRQVALCRRSVISSVLGEAQRQETLAITAEDWRNDPYEFYCNNGIFDMRTGEFRETQPEDMVKFVSPVDFTGLDTPAPTFERFLQEICDQGNEEETKDVVNYLGRLFGYATTGVIRDHVLTILWGENGFNGKDTLLETIHYIMGGDFASPMPQGALMSSFQRDNPNSAQPVMVYLFGKRLVWPSETEEGQWLDNARVKLITGGGAITTRGLYQNQFTFQPTHKVLLITNHKPNIKPDNATWGRIQLVPFKWTFVKEPSKPNERKIDMDLPDKLRAEASGILAWMLRNAMAYLKEGHLPTVDALTRETEAYRQEQGNFQEWADEQLVFQQDETCHKDKLYNSYRLWAETNGYTPYGGGQFKNQMVGLGAEYNRAIKKDGSVKAGFRGVRMRHPQDPARIEF